MRKTLIAGFIMLFAVTATMTAPAMAQDAEGGNAWNLTTIGAGAVVGIWAVNLASGGLAVGPIAASLALGNYSAAVMATISPMHAILITAGAVSGGYISALIFD